MPPDSAARSSLTPVAGGGTEDALADYCARPACRREFRRPPGPGRRREYCSDTCRRSVQREYRQATQRLSHFEGVVEQLRIDVAAYGRTVESDDPHPSPLDSRRAAEDALIRAGGIVAFLEESDEPLARELRALHAAVAPIVRGIEHP